MIIKYEDSKWINGIGTYFWILEDINNRLIELISFDKNFPEKIEILFFYLSVEISRMIPIKYNPKKDIRELNSEDGILQLKDNFKFLVNDYETIFSENEEELLTLNSMRNKYEHEPHNIKWQNYVGNIKSKNMRFVNEKYDPITLSKIDEDTKEKIEKGIIRLEWNNNTEQLINIVLKLNNTFIKIKNQFLEYFKNNLEAMEYPCFINIANMSIEQYNEQLLSLKEL